MNLKNVLRTYSLLRNLTDDESALLETLRGLSEGEREQLVESLSPGKVVAKKRKQNTKRRSDVKCAEKLTSLAGTPYVCGEVESDSIHDRYGQRVGYHEFRPRTTTKSPRAASLAEQIKSTGKPHLGEGPVCTICSHTEDYEDHAQPSPHYHPFAPPSSARNAVKKSSANSAESSSTANSEDEVESVVAVAGGSSE